MEHFLKEEQNKTVLREHMLLKRDMLSKQSRKQKSVEIWQNIKRTTVYKKADTIFTYVSAKTEVETLPFLSEIWKEGKKIAVPITEKNRNMIFVFLNDMEELTEMKWGILEPKKENSILAVPTENSLFIVPAVAMDFRGNRIGYGGGYYDTYFSKEKRGNKIGVVFQLQVVKQIQDTAKTDIMLDAMATESGICFFRGGYENE